MSLAALAAELGAVAAPAPSEKSWTRYLTERKSVVRMAAPYSLRRRTSSPRLHGAAIQWHRVLVLWEVKSKFLGFEPWPEQERGYEG